MKSGKQQSKPLKVEGNPARPAPANVGNPRLIIGICLFLALIVGIVFGQTRHFPFVNFDDDLYVYQDYAVTHGLTFWGAASAFNWNASDNWVPLTTLSHMLDWQLYAENAGGHHLTNLLLHATTAILLFLGLARMTGSVWRSAFVAAVFAIHPLRAESVAWIAERKDVLCGVFFTLTLLAYWNYVRHPRSLWRYLLALVLYALALTSKPVVVTLPILLLLLDYWPLRRIGWNGLPGSGTIRNPQPAIRILLEKIPFLLLSLASCLPTVLSERSGIARTEDFPIPLRIDNSLVSCVAYIWQMFYPAKLAVLYPYPSQGLPDLEVAGALAFLVAVSFAVYHCRKKHPYLLVGWLWYLIMLVPVIGLVQVGEQARADRHTYLSQIGLTILLTWLVADLSVRFRQRLVILASLSTLILVALICCAFKQTTYWKDSETLWLHTIASTSANPKAHLNLGCAYQVDGRLDDAIAQFRKVLEINPEYPLANFDLGNILVAQGHVDEAIAQYQQALKLDQGHDASQDYDRLARALAQKGQTDNAILAYQAALKCDPRDYAVYNNLGRALLLAGRLQEAATEYQAALKLQPENDSFQSNLGAAIWMLAKSGQANGDQVLVLAQNAVQIAGANNPFMLRALAAADARCGKYPDAIDAGNRAVALAANSQPAAFITTLQQEIALYQAGSPLPLLNQTNATNKP